MTFWDLCGWEAVGLTSQKEGEEVSVQLGRRGRVLHFTTHRSPKAIPHTAHRQRPQHKQDLASVRRDEFQVRLPVPCTSLSLLRSPTLCLPLPHILQYDACTRRRGSRPYKGVSIADKTCVPGQQHTLRSLDAMQGVPTHVLLPVPCTTHIILPSLSFPQALFFLLLTETQPQSQPQPSAVVRPGGQAPQPAATAAAAASGPLPPIPATRSIA